MNLNTIVYQSRYSSSVHTRTLTLSLTTLAIFSILLFCIPIFHAWQLYPYSFQNSTASYSALSGIFPWSDANGYYNGAYQFLDSGEINPWNSRRPLNVSLLATRLWLSNFNLQIALILQTIICALSVLGFSITIANRFGKKAGFLSFSILFLFIHNYLPTTLSEPLGLTLGCVSFIFLWDAAQRKSLPSLFFGAMTLLCALNARAGAFFVLPLLGVWVLYHFATTFPKRANYIALFVFALGLAAGFFYNTLLSGFYSSESGSAHSNFSLTLFGLIAGGKGWTYAYDLYPEIAQFSEAQSSQFLYEKSIAYFLQDPIQLFIGLWKNLLRVLKYSLVFFWQTMPESALARAFLRLLGAFFLINLSLQFKQHYRQNKSVFALLLAGILGMALSALIIIQDGGTRVFAATTPFWAAIVSITLTLYLAKPKFRIEKQSAFPIQIAYLLTTVLLVTGLFAPKFITKPQVITKQAFACPEGFEPIVVNHLAIMPQLSLPADSHQFLNNIKNSSVEHKESFLKVAEPSFVSRPSRLAFVFNTIKKQNEFIIGPEELFTQSEKESCLCGKIIPATNQENYISEVVKGNRYE